MADVVQETAYAFLKTVAPLHGLEEAALRHLVASAELRYYPSGSLVSDPVGPASFAYAIERGGLLLRDESDERTPDEVYGPGEMVGVAQTDPAHPQALMALEDTVVYALPSQALADLGARSPDLAMPGGRENEGAVSVFDRALLAPSRTIASDNPLSCDEHTSIQDAAAAMSERNVGSIVVVDASGAAVGIVTDSDLRRRVVTQARPLTHPVGTVMSHPVIGLDPDQPIFEALQRMLASNLHHLVLLSDGRPMGVISSHDLLLLEAQSPLALARNVDRQSHAPGLAWVIDRMQRLVPALVQQGMRAEQIAAITSEMNDRVVGRAVDLVERELGPAPVPYTWLALGSEGRKEQTFKTDQDNGILYLDPTPEQAVGTRQYFEELGRKCVSLLIDAGYPPCDGHYTSDNPRWVKSLHEWQRQFASWLADPEPQSVLSALIFFDFRPVSGTAALADELRRSVVTEASTSRRFLTQLAAVATDVGPPIGFLGRFAVERGGEHAHQIDLKRRGTGPIVDLARFLALEHGVTATSTLDRLEHLRESGAVPADTATDLAHAFESLLDLRIRRQCQQRLDGAPLSNYLEPESLSSIERVTLREAFKTLRSAQGYVRTVYRADRIAT
jgi:CBS domain-containing protein